MDIPKIVITGGPCAGKTTALAAICEWCQEQGFSPIIIPEAATNLIGSGLDPTRPEFQEYVIREILHAERIRTDAMAAATVSKPVFIYDRGLADGAAYVAPETFSHVLERTGLNIVTARDSYDGVIFLDSAAVGAERFYTTDNNDARRETIEEARAINQRTQEAWMGTPHLIPIRNLPGQNFEQKILECLKALARILGVPEPLERERKFLLHAFDRSQLPAHTVSVDIVQQYLVSTTGEAERVRARGQNNHWFYFHTLKRMIAPGEAAETDRMIGHGLYENLLVRRDARKLPIVKTRSCFLHDGRYFEQDTFHAHREGTDLFEVEVHDLSEEIVVPDFLGPYTEVTDDPAYSNYALADPV